MLTYIQSFVKYAVFVFLVNDYLKNNYTEKYNSLITTGGFSLIHMYSKIQILCNKLAASNPSILHLVNQVFNNTHSSMYEPDVEFILDGHVNFLGTKEELLNTNKKLKEALNELRSTQSQIIQQERLRALGEMASGIVHDFNNTLQPILGNTELLIAHPEYLDDKARVIQALTMINTLTLDASFMVGRLPKRLSFLK